MHTLATMSPHTVLSIRLITGGRGGGYITDSTKCNELSVQKVCWRGDTLGQGLHEEKAAVDYGRSQQKWCFVYDLPRMVEPKLDFLSIRQLFTSFCGYEHNLRI